MWKWAPFKIKLLKIFPGNLFELLWRFLTSLRESHFFVTTPNHGVVTPTSFSQQKRNVPPNQQQQVLVQDITPSDRKPGLQNLHPAHRPNHPGDTSVSLQTLCIACWGKQVFSLHVCTKPLSEIRYNNPPSKQMFASDHHPRYFYHCGIKTTSPQVSCCFTGNYRTKTFMQTSNWPGRFLLHEAKYVASREVLTSLQCARHKEQVWKHKLNSRIGPVLSLHMISNQIKTLNRTSLRVPKGDRSPSGCSLSIRQKQEPQTSSLVSKSGIWDWKMVNAIYSHYFMPQTTLKQTSVYPLSLA